jgi:hypothetical protein
MRELSVGNNLTANVKTTVYTVPTGYYAKWSLLFVVNHTGNNKYIDALWYDKSANTEIRVLDNYTLSPSQYIRFDGSAFVVLEEGDEIRLQSETGSDMSAINTIELVRKG